MLSMPPGDATLPPHKGSTHVDHCQACIDSTFMDEGWLTALQNDVKNPQKDHYIFDSET